MKAGRTGIILGLLAVAGLWLAGCNSAANKGSSKSGEAHEHDHAHHGPHHGHLMEIGGEEYHAEWTHEESGKVTFYILDADAKKEVPIVDEKIVIEVKIGENQPQSFELAAVNPKDGKTATFETVNNNLLGALETLKSPGVVATLHVAINGKQYEQRIEEHEHAH
jgi:hypothetical protein